ncbi:MAG: hypothetical protein ACJ8AT_32585 [Hyalangium sp.]|uniref:DUF7467 domain-containing protein n=1 Tax=Hyalangium sp. TaxID=2028555 RepID=UPI003899C098
MKNWFMFAVAASLVACGPQESDSLLAEGASGSADPGSAVAVGKPVPVAPPVQPGVTMGSELPPKPRLSPGMRSAATTWTVKMSATSSYLWPTQYTTLTATASADVGPTPYYIRIWDGQSGTFVASCGAGTTCSASVTRPTITFTSFVALIEDSSGYLQASSFDYDVYWHGGELALSATNTVAIGSSATVTATTNQDVGPSPFYVEIFDATAGTLLKSCGFGTSCSVQVSQSAASTHAYKAFLSQSSATFPPAGVQESTPLSYVTWATPGWSVSLSAPATTSPTVTVTATTNANVGPTPYYIQIYDEAGTRVGLCGYGTTCSVQFQPNAGNSHLVAFVAPSSTTMPPADAQAASNTVTATVIPTPR